MYCRFTTLVAFAALSLVLGCGKGGEPSSDVTTADLPPGNGPATPTASHSGTQQHSGAQQPAVDPIEVEEALAKLMEGNQRFVKGESIHPHESADYRASLAHQQHPFATVLTCSDSRVTPVLLFDQGIGDLFVIRVAGNVIDEDVAGSIEYAVDHLGAKLLIVLGHEDCGAVTAAYHAFVAKDLKQREPHEIESLLLRIEPALRDVDRQKPADEIITAAVELNVRLAIDRLMRFPDMQHAQANGLVKVVGAIYSVETGRVRILDM
jgi:carbonic anhydrase